MNYSNLIAWIAMLGIMSVGAPSIAAQVGGHIEGSHTMLSPADLKWIDSRHYHLAQDSPLSKDR